MRFGRAILLLLLATGLWAGPNVSAVEIGTARVNVIQELGEPASAIARGDSEVFTYRDGTKIKFKGGRVTEITGLKPAEPAVAATPPEAPTPPAPPAPAEPVLTKEQQAELEKQEKAEAEAGAKARAQMEQAIADMENPPPASFAEKATQGIVEFLIGLGLKWLMTIAALKLSCKYWNSEVPWTGIMLVSIVDVVIRGVIGYIGYELLHAMSLFYLDEAVSAFVMVLVLRKVSINQRLALAVEVVFTVKTFTIVVGSFVMTFVMRALV